MDDGCSKRFDIGTVDLRDPYETAEPPAAAPRPYSSYGQMLPPLTLPAAELPPMLTPIAPMAHMKERSILAVGDHQEHAWVR